MTKFVRLLTPTLRARLKSPLGLLIRGSFDETMEALRRLVENEKPPRVISVGDVVSDNMMKHGIFPKVLIVDNKVMREPVTPISVEADQTLCVKNPPGTLTNEAWSVIQEALSLEKRTKVLVDGEEDLLTLVAVLCAPENSFVIYGQPHEGIVVVKVTEQKKEMVRQVVESMKSSSKS
ncbi:MAG: hypothetical protein AOA65_1090 [Candidatus Bathyarchaeota archaeon BA1]|nr:MAG: hypothetical protein AOA65_1090 [Candidatus Bathyarchaeota archaeon BA1]